LMLRRMMTSSRYVIFVAIFGTLLASIALIVYETFVVAETVFDVLREGYLVSPKAGKILAVGVIEALDVFLIAIVAYIIALGLYALFVDDTLPLPQWLKIHDLEDLKEHLLSVIVAVLAVLFLREAVARSGDVDLLHLAIALAVIIAALTIFLVRKLFRKE
jgi:uncharacterized membrane protein YqhA